MILDENFKIYDSLKNEVQKYARYIGLNNISKDYLKNVIIPLVIHLVSKRGDKTLKFYISGGQGSGKSTVSKFIKFYLKNYFNYNVASFSLDDIYLSKKDRVALSSKVHPLLITRGVPGTHNVEQGIKIIKKLDSGKNQKIILPVFSKLNDDVAIKDNWVNFNGNPDFIIFDGWCVGAEAQPKDFWKGPINDLEKKYDKDGQWSKWVNTQLLDNYQKLFNLFDISIYIKSKNFKQIIRNRWEQEKTNIKTESIKSKTNHLKTYKEIHHFAMHFERITKCMEKYMPEKVDILLMRQSKYDFSLIKK